MNKEQVTAIENDPNFQTLVKNRTQFGWTLTILMLVVYFTFILTIAFNPSALGQPLSADGVMSVGIPVGITIIIFAFVITGVYVRRANNEFDDLTQKIKNRAREMN